MLVALLLVSVPVRGLCRAGAAHRLRGCCGDRAGGFSFLQLPLAAVVWQWCGSGTGDIAWRWHGHGTGGVAVGPVMLCGGMTVGLVPALAAVPPHPRQPTFRRRAGRSGQPREGGAAAAGHGLPSRGRAWIVAPSAARHSPRVRRAPWHGRRAPASVAAQAIVPLSAAAGAGWGSRVTAQHECVQAPRRSGWSRRASHSNFVQKAEKALWVAEQEPK